ncbi:MULTISPECIES: hypothetical protein [Bradyrhizobium]|uniref:hypothetical protein n=1 Tax=Bradyrhizobium TaxID=374 RepID=UPI001EDBEE8F|nr:hypothetical protein [Bradyrhizobium zhengyangense]MCG2641663.1 hypothetical protein [Bradyrhizobium zhengyangense]
MQANLGLSLQTLVSVVFAAQLALFSFRIKREIDVADGKRKAWFPIPDYINILSMLSVTLFCIVLPLAYKQFDKASAIVFSIAAVLLAFHPICMLGHYGLLPPMERPTYATGPNQGDYRYCTWWEGVFIILALALAGAAGVYVNMKWSP